MLDAHLAGQEFVAGNASSVADIAVGCAAHRWLGLPIARIARPNIERWHAAMKARPGAQLVLSQPIK